MKPLKNESKVWRVCHFATSAPGKGVIQGSLPQNTQKIGGVRGRRGDEAEA